LYRKTTLENGLRIVTSRMEHVRSVSVCLYIGVGSRYENGSEAGISHFIEHLLFKGTEKRPTALDISAAIEGVGGTFNGGTDKELTVFWSKVAQPHFHLALDVLVDMLLNSTFDPLEVEKERQVIIDEIGLSNDLPSQRVNMLIDELLWPGHPLGRDVAGSRESVTAISRDMMLSCLQGRYLPGNTVVAIAGDIDHNAVVADIARLLGDWTGNHPRPSYLAYQPQPSPKICIEKRETEQVHLCLGLPGLSLSHPRRFVLDLLNVILGEGMSSRLFAEIRDKLGLAYSIHSYVEHLLDSGAVTVYAGVEPKDIETALRAIMEQLSLLREKVPEAELVKAKELAKGRLMLRMEDSRAVSGWLGGQEVLSSRMYSVDEIVSIIDAITAEELKTLAQEILVEEQIRLAVVGPVRCDEPLDSLLKL